MGLNTNLTNDTEKSGISCYQKCNQNFTGLGAVCWQDCPNDGFRDDGAYCFKMLSYGRGGGYPWQGGDSLNLQNAAKRCIAANADVGCEIYGSIVYPKCKPGFYNVGCCICSQKCPENMTDIGISCRKSSYWRGLGKLCINSTIINILG